jgi:hypothetical protein
MPTTREKYHCPINGLHHRYVLHHVRIPTPPEMPRMQLECEDCNARCEITLKSALEIEFYGR